jgi:hypothetical protein
MIEGTRWTVIVRIEGNEGFGNLHQKHSELLPTIADVVGNVRRVAEAVYESRVNVSASDEKAACHAAVLALSDALEGEVALPVRLKLSALQGNTIEKEALN